MMDYDALRAEQAALRARGIYRGIGLASFIEMTNPGPAFYGVGGARISAQDGATVRFDAPGCGDLQASVTEQGQGTGAMLTQIVATALGVAPARVRVVLGDTDATPYGGGTWASRGAGIGGEAAWQAACALRDNALRWRAACCRRSRGRWTWRAAPWWTGETGRERHDAARAGADRVFPAGYAADGRAGGTDGGAALRAAASIRSRSPTGRRRRGSRWIRRPGSSGCCGIGWWRIAARSSIRCWWTSRSGAGWCRGWAAALFEQCLYDEQGQMMNANMADYLVPMAGEMPDIDVAHVATPTADSALGAKGAGEAGTAGAASAVLNAVNDALAPLRAAIWEIPLTPERILQALRTPSPAGGRGQG